MKISVLAAQNQKVVFPYSPIISLIPKSGLVWNSWKKVSKANKRRVRESPAEQQMDVSHYSKVKLKYGVYRNSSPYVCHSFGHKNSWAIVQRTSQVTSMPEKDIFPGRQRGWLTASHLSIVLLLTIKSRPALVERVVTSAPVIVISLPLPPFLNHNRQIYIKSPVSLALGLSLWSVAVLFLALCVSLQRGRQTAGQMHSIYTPLTSFNSSWLKTGCRM